MSVVCFVSYEIHPTTMGGCGVLIHHAAEVLLEAGHEVVLLLDVPAAPFAKFINHDLKDYGHVGRIRAYRVDDLCSNVPFTPQQFQTVFQGNSYRFSHALKRLLEKEPCDVVEYFDYCGAGYYSFVERLFAETPGPVLSTRLHGSLEVLDRHGQGSVKDLDRLTIHALERRALSLSEAVLTPSRTYFERYYRDLYKLESAHVVVSSPPKQALPKVTRRPRPGEAFTIAFIGRMFHLKGADQLVHAAVMLMKQRPDLRFTVDMIGYDSDESPVNGSYTAYLQTLIPQRLRERFAFRGQLPHEAISARLEHALFAIFPNRIESFCYALHEVYDAGVPVVVNGIPAFADFFEHERNALVYDGTTQGLLAQMRRMIDDAPMRERLCRPYPVADHPIGEFYERPRAIKPLSAAGGSVIDPLVVVLCEDGHFADGPALRTLSAQTLAPSATLCLVPAQPDAEETLWWLGRPWHVRSPSGGLIETSDVLTTGALCLLRSTDELDASWLQHCVRALSRRPAMAFAGTWSTVNGTVQTSTLDLMPELFPFESGKELARVLVRTPAGVPLPDLLDPSLGDLGHTGYLWQAVQQWGHGTLLPRPLISTRSRPAPADPLLLQALLTRFSEGFAERLALYAGICSPKPGYHEPKPTLDQKVRLAGELGGSLLAKMALKKLAKRVRRGGPPRPARP